LEKTFYIKNLWEDLIFAMMIKKVNTSFGGVSKGAKTSDFKAIFRIKLLFCQHPLTPPNLKNKCISLFYNTPPNFKPKY